MPQSLKVASSSAYEALLRQVRNILIEGQKRIEQERVRTYWETGRLIHTHILKHKDRGEYGAEVVRRLADDLNIHFRLLQRCIQFARTYPQPPKVSGRTLFTWSHYRELITVSDPKKRFSLERAISQKGWNADELASRIKGSRGSNGNSHHSPMSEIRATRYEPLVPLRGHLHTYQVVERPTVGGEPELLVDLGFGVFRKIPLHSRLSKGDFIGEDFKKKEATPKDLYTYEAVVEKMIDADTLKVRLNLGYGDSIRQVLRLRGIDAPEVNTKEGSAAKAFVQSHIKEAQMIIVRSSKSDKYDRYLADVFLPGESGEEIYLNNLLLEKRYAVRIDY